MATVILSDETAFEVTTSDGVRLAAVLSPATNSPRAVALLLHGYTSGKNNKTNRALVPRLAEAGVASLRFDFRGHYESDGDIADVTISTGLLDMRAVAAKIEEVAPAPTPLLIFGTSYGGAVGIAGAAELRTRALVLKSPVSDYVEVRRLQLGWRGMLLWRLRGWTYIESGSGKVKSRYGFVQDARRWNLYEKSRDAGAALRLVHGDQDSEVPLAQSERLIATVSDSDLCVIEGADHQYSREEHFDAMINYCVRAIVSLSHA